MSIFSCYSNWTLKTQLYPTLSPVAKWEAHPLHNGPITGMDMWGQFELATVGEDGDIVIVDLSSFKPKSCMHHFA